MCTLRTGGGLFKDDLDLTTVGFEEIELMVVMVMERQDCDSLARARSNEMLNSKM